MSRVKKAANRNVAPFAGVSADVMPQTIRLMFKRDADGKYRGLVAGLSESTQRAMSADYAGFVSKLAEPVVRGKYRPKAAGVALVSSVCGTSPHCTIALHDSDVVIQAAILHIIAPALICRLHRHSFGAYPVRDVPSALLIAKRLIDLSPNATVIAMTIVRGHLSIPIRDAIARLRPYICDPRLLQAIGATYRTRPQPGVIEQAGLEYCQNYYFEPEELKAMWEDTRGLPESSPLAPIGLAMYLRPLISAIDAIPSVLFVHCGDEILLVVRQGEDVARVVRRIQSVGRQHGLNLAAEVPVEWKSGARTKFLGHAITDAGGSSLIEATPDSLYRLAARVESTITNRIEGADVSLDLRAVILPFAATHCLAAFDVVKDAIARALHGVELPVRVDWLTSEAEVVHRTTAERLGDRYAVIEEPAEETQTWDVEVDETQK